MKKIAEIDRTSDYVRINYLALRKLIGLLGMFLPLLLFLGVWIFNSCSQPQESISQYYYTIMGDVFVAVLGTIAIFLIAYKGPSGDKLSWLDNTATNVAGILAFCIAIFPTPNIDLNDCILGMVNSEIPEIHNYCAFLFFLIISLMSFFLFTRNKEKVGQNWVYRICGIVMLLCTVLLLLVFFETVNIGIGKPIFWLETMALLAFGVSWLVKGMSF